jgi:4-hydroxy 2-oxovalerate aldolase
MMNKYLKIAGSMGKRIGIHAHNNLQLAFANTVEAINSGANLVDATLAGLGRGAGNCPLEMLVGFLHNPKYRMRPLLECVEKYIEPMRVKLGWGFDYPYMMTGFLNNHPRSAMEYNENPDKRGKIVNFYDDIMK